MSLLKFLYVIQMFLVIKKENKLKNNIFKQQKLIILNGISINFIKLINLKKIKNTSFSKLTLYV